MMYAIFELAIAQNQDDDGNSYVLKNTREKFEDKQDAIDKIKTLQEFSWASYTILEEY